MAGIPALVPKGWPAGWGKEAWADSSVSVSKQAGNKIAALHSAPAPSNKGRLKTIFKCKRFIVVRGGKPRPEFRVVPEEDLLCPSLTSLCPEQKQASVYKHHVVTVLSVLHYLMWA